MVMAWWVVNQIQQGIRDDMEKENDYSNGGPVYPKDVPRPLIWTHMDYAPGCSGGWPCEHGRASCPDCFYYDAQEELERLREENWKLKKELKKVKLKKKLKKLKQNLATNIQRLLSKFQQKVTPGSTESLTLLLLTALKSPMTPMMIGTVLVGWNQ